MQATALLAKESSYRPSEDEPFMNERQQEYFKQKLLHWKEREMPGIRRLYIDVQTRCCCNM